jgi:methionine synthase I (cobalamin-dependent)
MGPGSFYRLAVRGPYIWKVEREFDNLNWLHLPGKKCSLTRPHSCHHIPDAFLLETCSTPRARYALGRLQIEDVPQGMVSLAYQRNGKGKLVTQSGHSPEWFARRAKDWGCVALGINCGKDIGMDDIIEIVRRYRQETDLPLFARPNAGTPTRKGKKLVYPLTPQALADRLPELLGAGVCMVGGCCGTRPEHIAACRRIIDEWNRATTRTQQMQGARGT